MDGYTFEQYLRTAFTRLGYSVTDTRFRGDYGGDLVVRKNGTKTVVQAKRWTKNVGVKAVQEAVAAKGYYDADAAMVVTNARYTTQAKTLAMKNNVQLWDRDDLVSILLRTKAAESATAAAASPTAPEVDAAPTIAPAVTTPTPDPICAECGIAVSEKVYAYCVDHAERFGGAIYCFKHQRRFRRRFASG
jgi:restriction system protein